MCEILAPAGDEAAFFAALNAGADAIYLGLRGFSARANAANFTPERLAELIRRAHMLGVRVHVALNTLVKEEELPAFFESAKAAWEAGADALIVQDLFLGAQLKKSCPQLILHLSTQAGVCNVYGARLAKECGFSRVILARETPLADIRAVAKEIETEVFVQGALCTCFSGQCYLSSFVGGNSGNRGLCKQPCRKRYTTDRKGFEGASYTLSLSDLCVGERVKELAEAGVYSFKIEGRMRSAAYVGAAVKYYKDIFNGEGRQTLAADLSDVTRAYNRGGFTRGYAFGEGKDLHSASVQGHMGERIGTVARFSKNGKYAYISSAFSPRNGDGFKLIRGGKTEVGGGSWCAQFGADKGGFFLPAEKAWQIGDGVYITADTALGERIAARRRLEPLQLFIKIAAGAPPFACVRGRFGERTFTADFRMQTAKSSPLTEEDVRGIFSKTDGLPFAVCFAGTEIGEGLFAVRSQLNAFRRAVFEGAAQALAGEARRPVSLALPSENPLCRPSQEGEIAVLADSFSPCLCEAVKIDHVIFKPKNYRNEAEICDFLHHAEYYAWHNWLYLPPFMTTDELALLNGYADKFYGIYGEGIWAVQYCKERGLRLFAGVGFNLFNSIAVRGVWEAGAQQIALSKELSAAELKNAGAEGAFVVAGGGAKAMELAHCPFGRSCAACDKKRRYILTDEAGRKFPLVRYETSVCRFELYNSVFVSHDVPKGAGRLYDLTALSEQEKKTFLQGEGDTLPHTAGAYKSGIN